VEDRGAEAGTSGRYVAFSGWKWRLCGARWQGPFLPPLLPRLLAMGLATLLLAGHALATAADDQRAVPSCSNAIAAAEVVQAIPHNLLRAIAIAESGRPDVQGKSVEPWPWTITAEGQGRFLASKAEAELQLSQLRQRGLQNIDVGCMQINLFYHADAFASSAEAFDVSRNVDYGARHLRALYAQTGSWRQAVGRYHSYVAELGEPYSLRVMEIWNGISSVAATARQPLAILASGPDAQRDLMARTFSAAGLPVPPELLNAQARARQGQPAQAPSLDQLLGEQPRPGFGAPSSEEAPYRDPWQPAVPEAKPGSGFSGGGSPTTRPLAGSPQQPFSSPSLSPGDRTSPRARPLPLQGWGR
jgi:hypothetical protein